MTRDTARIPLAPWAPEQLELAYETTDDPEARCQGCGLYNHGLLYRDSYGEWACPECICVCPECGQGDAVAVSARRPADDPTAPGQVDHVCPDCLTANWLPGETLLPAPTPVLLTSGRLAYAVRTPSGPAYLVDRDVAAQAAGGAL